MDEYEIATQRLAQVARILRLVNFKMIQLRHTHDQLLAGLEDLIGQVRLIARSRLTPDDDAPLPQHRKDSQS